MHGGVVAWKAGVKLGMNVELGSEPPRTVTSNAAECDGVDDLATQLRKCLRGRAGDRVSLEKEAIP